VGLLLCSERVDSTTLFSSFNMKINLTLHFNFFSASLCVCACVCVMMTNCSLFMLTNHKKYLFIFLSFLMAFFLVGIAVINLHILIFQTWHTQQNLYYFILSLIKQSSGLRRVSLCSTKSLGLCEYHFLEKKKMNVPADRRL
jgi:hypothetical protein